MAKPPPQKLTAAESAILKKAIEKRNRKEELNQRELTVLEKAEKIRRRSDVDKLIPHIPASLYYDTSEATPYKTQTTIKEFGIPIPKHATDEFDLKGFFEWFHRFIEENRKRLSLVDSDDMMSGPNSPWVEKYRREQTLLARLKRKREEGILWPKEMIVDCLLRAAFVLRRGGKAMQRKFGRDAAEELERLINEFTDKVNELLNEEQSASKSDDE